jgi:hypothetical protein
MFIANQRGYPGHCKYSYTSGFSFNLNNIPELPMADTNFKNPYDNDYITRVQEQAELWLSKNK